MLKTEFHYTAVIGKAEKRGGEQIPWLLATWSVGETTKQAAKSLLFLSDYISAFESISFSFKRKRLCAQF